MDRNTCKNLRPSLKAALDGFAALDEFDIEVGNASYDDVSATFKITLKDAGAKSRTESYAETEAERLGIKMVNQRGDQIVDYNFKAPKYPWIVQKADGKRYKFTTLGVKASFAA